MTDDVRITSTDGQDPRMTAEEIVGYIAEAGNPVLAGDWYSKTINKPPTSVPKESVTGRVSLDMAAYLDAFEPGEIEQRIKTFKKRVAAATDVDSVRQLLLDLLMPQGWSSTVRPFSTLCCPAFGGYLFRVRPGLEGPENIRTVGDIWTPPAGTSDGRVNRAGQPILYTSVDWPGVALRESGAKSGEIVAVSCFAVVDELPLLNFDDMDPHWNLSVGQQRKWRSLAEFYRWAFRHSGTNPDSPEHLVPQVLTLDYHMLVPPLVGYAYRSVAVNRQAALNVALDEREATNRLRLMVTNVWRLTEPDAQLLASLVPKRRSLSRETPLIPNRRNPRTG